MINPASNSVQQQIPANNAVQPGVGQQNKVEQPEKDQETTRPSGTSTAQSQETETRNNGQTEQNVLNASVSQRGEDFVKDSGGQGRGSVVDITI